MNEPAKPAEKAGLHPRNRHRFAYDFKKLITANPDLAPFVSVNKYGTETISFHDPKAVLALNKSLLMSFYGLQSWDIPSQYLCPPVPGRADYIHYLADLLASSNSGKIPLGPSVRVLDIGTGASCIYPIIGQSEYGWRFTGTDIDTKALQSATAIVQATPRLKSTVDLRLQKSRESIFEGILQKEDAFDFCMCNPPFHSSPEEARAGTERKWKNLGYGKDQQNKLNFGGQQSELWCPGGEEAFVGKMIEESAACQTSFFWFSCLISKGSHLRYVYRKLKSAGALDVRTLDMAQGQKTSRAVAWTFLNPSRRTEWRVRHWENHA
jgi:23S rRNA (adenine1618-N6)-methyltransferase